MKTYCYLGLPVFGRSRCRYVVGFSGTHEGGYWPLSSFPVYALIHLVPFTGFTQSLRDDEAYCYLACWVFGLGGCRYVVGWI